ncbi:MAG: DUF3256 family protein [Massilibacteroides sp.]|nr:DUF3256 family protein [Massilibacteroides sp.]MDD3063579.1 DUF3256 family protein [Massilibacteroides sp.]MDD4114252.1 DUF3256 family protein [Massilibacteroides sp.]MDD4661004.1 DUF3256 family protein [Massilibacteroides sp.]
MKRTIFLPILLLFFVFLSVKGQDMSALFTAMPDEYVPYLESAWRKDLVELYSSGKQASLKNTLNGTSALLKLTDDYLLLQSSERSTIEMKLLPLINNTYIICVVTTVNGPVPDSRIAFFTTEWKPLKAENLITLVSGDWFIKADTDRTTDAYKDAVSQLDMELIQYRLNPDNLTLTATYMTPQYLGREEREKVTPYLKETPKLFTWENSRFN